MFKTIIKSYGTLLLLSFGSGSALAEIPVTYNVKADSNQPDIIKVDTKTNGNQALTWVKPRQYRDNEFAPQLTCLKRDGTSSIIVYGQPIACSKVTWEVTTKNVEPSSYSPSDQYNAHNSKQGWYVLTEWNTLPRIKEQDQIQVCSPEKDCALMPTTSQPPFFMVWGMPKTVVDLASKQVVVHSDLPQLIEKKELWLPSLENQLNYLLKVFPDNHLQNWGITFFAKDKAERRISGSSGVPNIFVNVWTDKGVVTNESLQWLLKISAHESLHLLQNKLPANGWTGESLAEYYALKSMENTSFAFKDPIHRWNDFAEKYPFSSTGLIEANKNVDEKKEYQYYPLFYFKGPAFWYEVDTALQNKGSNLDQIINSIDVINGYQLSPTFVAVITNKIGMQRWNEIKNKYL
ncbi:hypothetical protein [Photobacterium angustum]|uniref:hypothetical protein n=1 Tax=Photobacterium angustum TaxID=661 RepID=UPI00069CB351|nr:hypothetical protein [Photobacterium angustum]PSV66230.1 hypothetical protein CTM95_12360 [Photobacterium angustum]